MRTRRNTSRPRPNKFTVRQPATGRERLVASTLTGMALLATAPPGQALSLGELSVHSQLGQRLDVSVPVQLAAGESLASGCIQATAGGSNDLGHVPNAAVITPEAARPGQYTLRISSAAALYEPIYALSLQANCPGTATITRQYVLMLDLPGMTTDEASVPAQPPVTQPQQLPAALPASLTTADSLRTPAPRQRPLRARRTLDAAGTPILPGTSYQVTAGDTLSSIAARVSGRQVNLWTLAGQIFTANPAAFIRNDINLIKLGSTIVIPAIDTAALGAAAMPATLPAPAPVPLPEAVSAPVLATLPPEVEDAAAANSTVAAEVATTPAPAATPVSRIAPAAPPAARPATPTRAPPKVSADAPATTAASPLAATASGIIFGLLVSALLWFRNRLPAVTRKRTPKPAATPAAANEVLPLAAAIAPKPIAVRMERAEPSITVQWSARPDDSLADEFPAVAAAPVPPAYAARASAGTTDEITSELEKLFGDDSETMNTPAPAMQSMPGNEAADDDGADDKKAETLLQALSLLERDYEAELTASQVLDLSAMREALATGTDSRPYIKKPD
ncbi:MAG: pilus assembly protein FimV [Pseudomonadota bacterium]|nr:pilus assembly protein FimV [Pseudomonadota bacterium]